MGRRILGQHFKRDGRPKRSYATPEDAKADMRNSPDKIYQCDFCGFWHRATDAQAIAERRRQKEKKLKKEQAKARERRKARGLAPDRGTIDR